MVQPAPPSSCVELVVAQRTDPGLDPDKQVNEDACAAGKLPLGHLLVVCDGMGGHVGGKDASEAAVRTIFTDIENAPADTNPGAALKAAIEHAGQVVYDLGGGSANLLRPGSTVVAILSHTGGSEVAHVGDSRAYVMRDGQIYPLTRDHSMVQQMIDAGVLKPEEAVGHPDANKITRALGMTATVDVELRPTPFAHQKGDVYLLASDGLCDLVGAQELLGITQQARMARGLDFATHQLISTANGRGGHDNITVLLAEIVACPPCSSIQPKTVVPEGGVIPIDMPATTAPIPPTAGTGATEPRTPATGAMNPTIVDSPVPPAAQPSMMSTDSLSTSPTPTWIDEDAVGDTDTATDQAKQRRLVWLVVGIAIVLFGLALVVSSIFWVLATAAMDPSAPSLGRLV